MPNSSASPEHFFHSPLLQIISPVENDVVLEDMFERTTTANSNASIEEEIDEGEDKVSGNSKQFFIHSVYRDFITVFSRRITGFHRWTKLLELSFFVRKPFCLMVKPARQNHPHSRSICAVPDP